jgi:hypothetical protein
VRRRLSLSLDDFGASALEEVAKRISVSPADLARHAARYYLSDRDSGRMALRVPRLPRGGARKGALRLELELDADTWRELEAETRRQDVSVEALLRHAIFYLLADLDSGRAGRRFLEDESG